MRRLGQRRRAGGREHCSSFQPLSWGNRGSPLVLGSLQQACHGQITCQRARVAGLLVCRGCRVPGLAPWGASTQLWVLQRHLVAVPGCGCRADGPPHRLLLIVESAELKVSVLLASELGPGLNRQRCRKAWPACCNCCLPVCYTLMQRQSQGCVDNRDCWGLGWHTAGKGLQQPPETKARKGEEKKSTHRIKHCFQRMITHLKFGHPFR